MRSRLVLDLLTRCLARLHRRVAQREPPPEGLNRVQLNARGRPGGHNVRGAPQELRGHGHRPCVVARTVCDDALPLPLGPQCRDGVEGPAELEGAPPLEDLRLAEDLPASRAVDRARGEHRRHARHACQPRRRGLDAR